MILSSGVSEAYVGSLYARRKQNDPRGGRLVNFCVQNKIDNNSNSRIKMLLNNKISEAGVWVDEFGMPIKKVRIAEPTKALWSTGIHQKTSLDNSNKTVGDLILKLDRSLQLCELAQNESNNIDVVCEAGLGTINASICARPDYLYFDDTLDVNIDNLSVIPKNWKEYYQYPDLVRDGYSDVVKKFRNFAQNKKDHVFISDPLRYLFVSGRNAKKAGLSSKPEPRALAIVTWPARATCTSPGTPSTDSARSSSGSQKPSSTRRKMTSTG